MTKRLLEFGFAVLVCAIAIALAVDTIRPYMPFLMISVVIVAVLGGAGYVVRRQLDRRKRNFW